MTRDTENLENWRKEIRTIDDELIAMAARRMELARKIGQFKVQNQLPIKDASVEQEIIGRTRKLAETLGLDPHFAEALITLVMEQSVNEQNKLQPTQN